MLPFSWLHGLVLRGRHALYDLNLFRSFHPEVRTIVVGNLALGGTGKTPHVELVLDLLKDSKGPVCTLSRGYGRRSRGFHEVRANDTAARTGDEPLQIKRAHPHVRVFVDADRVKGIARIRSLVPDVKVVVLDDALQHRRLRPDLSLLLTTWQRPYSTDLLFPAGRLRDLPSRARVAQAVIVTKCPATPSPEEQKAWRAQLRLEDHQELYFSTSEQESPRVIQNGGQEDRLTDHGTNALIFTGIADPAPLVAHARTLWGKVEHVAFPDHHAFTPADLRLLAARYANFAAGPCTLVTTPKDAARLASLLPGSPLADLPLLVIGVKARILNEPQRFATLIAKHAGTD